MRGHHVIQCVVQSPSGVFRDLRRNMFWIFGGLASIFASMLVLASVFYWYEVDAQNAEPKPILTFNWWSSLYFTAINFTTVGFGDLSPRTSPGRLIAVLNSILGLISFGWLVSVITLALQRSDPTKDAVLSALVEALTDRASVRERSPNDNKSSRVRIFIENYPYEADRKS